MVSSTQIEASKHDEAQRTFETRLLFIRDIFTHKYSQEDIFKKCVEHKLNRSYEVYLAEVNRCFDTLINKITDDPLRVLKNIK